MLNEKTVTVDLKRQTLYPGSVSQDVSLTAGSSTSCTFTFGSDNRILLATLTRAWPASSWSNALVTVCGMTINDNVVTLDLTTNYTQTYNLTVSAIYHLA